MSHRKSVAGVLLILSVPALLALRDAISFHAHNRNNGFIISSGQRREYLLHVPQSCDASRPSPLVISMHGAGCWPVQQMEMSRWNDLADRERFIVVYPAGEGGAGPRIWHSGPHSDRDVRFIADLIDKLEKDYNIDSSRIYANGMSNGGGMTFLLSCTLSDRIAAFGLVGAAPMLPWSACNDHRPVPMIDFHGTADTFSPYTGGTSWVSDVPFPAVPSFAANWARRNRCGSTPAESAAASDVTRREYTHCADNASVVLYTIRNGGHTWPGGQPPPEWFAGPTSRNIDATREMWAFFRAHRLVGVARDAR